MGRHYPHDLYEEIPILEAARRCGLVLNDRTLEWDEVEASCPFCGDRGPGKYHLSLNTRKNQYRCNLCEASGNSVSLYARMNGTSYRQAHEVLSKDGGIYRFPQQPLSQKPPEPEPKPLAMRHDVYYDMLSHLTLSPKHHNDLLSRGLSEERISQNMYRSLPSGTSARRLLAGMLSDFHDLEGIPGFYVDKDGFWNISGHSGLLVPYCTMDGYIQGLQVRLDDEKNPERKYRWLASRGRPHGVRCPAWIHVTGNPIHTCEWEELTLPVNELTADPPKDMRKAKNYLRLLQEGTADFPPLVCVNRMVIDGQHRFWAYRQAGFQQVKVYQNKPWAMPAAA